MSNLDEPYDSPEPFEDDLEEFERDQVAADINAGEGEPDIEDEEEP